MDIKRFKTTNLGGETEMKIKKMECPICKKEFSVETYIAREGCLRGQTMLRGSGFCSKECSDKFKKLITSSGENTLDITQCPSCHCLTKNIKNNRCGKCGEKK